MIKKILFALLAVGLFCFGVFYVLTEPEQIRISTIPKHKIDLINGEEMFWAGGCSSCHAAPNAQDEDKLILSGGLSLETPFGAFKVPNISPDPETGIGAWSQVDFLNAMIKGVSPKGEHYYPAFPYTNFQRMPMEDLMDLKAFLDQLPKSSTKVADHDLPFLFSIRRPLGLWKFLYANQPPFSYAQTRKDKEERGQYLTEGPGHCGACHTPRDLMGGKMASKNLAGTPAFEGPKGKKNGSVPNITPHMDGLGNWSQKDIIFAFETGMTPEFDSFGGTMVAVQGNLSKLSSKDRTAIAAYLMAMPPIASTTP